MAIFSKLKSWGITIYSQEKLDIPNIDKSKVIYHIPLANYWGMNPVFVNADPFLFVWNDKLFLFYERQRYTSVGEIYMVSTIDLKTWTKPRLVLKERCHLSFPFVFEDNGIVYMMPESSGLHQIRLYRASNPDLTEFEYVKSLEKLNYSANDGGVHFVDSCILKKNNIYYLFTSIKDIDGNYTCQLYLSENLLGEYKEHPCSPINVGKSFGRNGGCILSFEDSLLRVAQNCENDYGDNLSLVQINVITPTEYSENVVQDNFINRSNPRYKEGGHHLNIVQYKGKYIISSDYKSYRRYFRHLRYDIYRCLKI